MTKNYLQLDWAKGMFYQYSKEEKAGFEKHVSSKENVSYRKYADKGVIGVLESVSIREGNFGNEVSFQLKNGEDVIYANIGLSDQKGNVDTYAESIIRFLPQLNKGDNLTIYPYNFIPEGDKYANIGVVFRIDSEKIKSTMTNAYYKEGKLVKGDIPAIEWKKNPLGKNKPTATSLEAKDEYLLKVLKVQEERLGKETPAPAPAPKSKAKETSVKNSDDLPF